MPADLWKSTDADFRLALRQIQKMFEGATSHTELLIALAEREAVLRAEVRFRCNENHPKG
jgi:hypothetical protein